MTVGDIVYISFAVIFIMHRVLAGSLRYVIEFRIPDRNERKIRMKSQNLWGRFFFRGFNDVKPRSVFRAYYSVFLAFPILVVIQLVLRVIIINILHLTNIYCLFILLPSLFCFFGYLIFALIVDTNMRRYQDGKKTLFHFFE